MTTPHPNIAPAGYRRRRRFAYEMLAVAVGLLAACFLLRAAWLWRALVFFPAAASALSFLQVRRDTCVLRAAEGTCEHEDGTTTRASDDDVRASRAVARTIHRDAVLIGLAGAMAAIATSKI